MKNVAWFGFVAFVACCTPKPNPPIPIPDAGDGGAPADAGPDVPSDVCELACSRLRALGCPEGAPKDGSSCEGVCQHAGAGQFDLHPGCIADAKTVEAVRGCGSVKCKQ